MPESDFDPYLKWLGIRDSERPINHYRLLGLALFERDADVISAAADRQMAHVRTYQNGPNGELSQRLMNELASARRCLLVEATKQAYDQALRQQLDSGNMPPVATPMASSPPTADPIPVVNVRTSTTVVDNAEVNVQADANLRSKRQRREKGRMLVSLVGWITGGLAGLGAGALILNYIQPEPEPAPPTAENRITDVAPKPDGQPDNLIGEATAQLISDPKPSQPESPHQPNHSPAPDFNDPMFPWTVERLNEYPKPDRDITGMIVRAHFSVRTKRFLSFEKSNSSTEGQSFRTTVSTPSVMIGVVATKTEEGHVKTIQPVFLGPAGAHVGRAFGRRQQPEHTLVAQPGYAVGEMEISNQSPIQGLRLTYMRMTPVGLDPDDRYFSPWFGIREGEFQTVDNPDGFPLVGIYGNYLPLDRISSLGLIAGPVDLSRNPTSQSLATSTGSTAGSGGSNGFFPPSRPSTASSNLNVRPPEAQPETSSMAPAANLVSKLTEPDSRDRKIAEKSLRELYQHEFEQANSIPKVQALARQLITDAVTADGQEVRVFVLLEQAALLAITIGDARTAVDAIRHMDERYEIDFWRRTRDAIDDAAKNSNTMTSGDFKLIMDDLIDDSINHENYDQAEWLIGRASKMARRAGDNSAYDGYLTLRKDVQQLQDLSQSNESAVLRLSANPEDPEANLQRGDYLFVMNEDDPQAFAHWAKSDDEGLQRLARLESESDHSNIKTVVALADAFAQLGKDNRTIRDKKFLQRALHFYQIARYQLEGLELRKVQVRIDSISQLVGE